MRIALRIFISYLVLSLLLGGLTLLAAWWSVGRLVDSVVNQAAAEMGREIGLFLTSTGRHSLDELTEQEQRLLQEQIRDYTINSERVETMLLIDNDCRIRFSSDPGVIGMEFREPAERRMLLSDEVTVRSVPRGGSGYLREITVPIRSLVGGRLGTLRVRLIPQYFAGYLDEPRRTTAMIFVGMIVFITASGIALASLMTIPVRRLNRTLLELQKKGGAAQVVVDDRSDFAPALRVVRGLGERLESLAASSRSREQMLATITHAVEQGVVVLDQARQIVQLNDSARQILACGSGEEGTEAARDLLEHDPELAGVIAAAGEEPGRTTDLEASGGPVTRPGLRVSAFPLREAGREAGTILLLRDLQSVRALDQHLQEAGRLSILARLTATVAHEIKNPLNSMVINAEALRGALAELPPEQRAESERTVDIIVREIYHLDEMIREFLGLAAGGEREPVQASVQEVSENVVDLLRFEANQARVRIALELARDLPPVPVSPPRLRQALMNLCLNGIESMPGGGLLTVRTRAAGGGVEVEVADTGTGIPDEIRPFIFDFDFTTKAQGSGLGLPITRMIVEGAGGTIEIDSRAGGGTTFRLRFPVHEAAPAA